MTPANNFDVVAFAAHPDDIELQCGGTIALLANSGYRIALVDLSRGELGTNGTAETRAQEAKLAAEKLAVTDRLNLGLPDGGLNPHDAEQLTRVTACIRELRPKIAFVPYWEERHPDHIAASELLTRAFFFANVGGYKTPPHNSRHHTVQVLYYQMRIEFRPSFIVDISEFAQRKLDAIHCFGSQVAGNITPGQQPTLLNSEKSLQSLLARSQHYGAMIGVAHGEPFLTRNVLSISDPVKFFGSQQQPYFFPG